jgi:formylmethanofuran dehydrogenase subunit E
MIMVDRPDLHLVEDLQDVPCSLCGEPATTRSAVDGAALCLSCFTETHWHPSWSKSFDERPPE